MENGLIKRKKILQGDIILVMRRLMATLIMIVVVYTVALSVAIWGFVQVYSFEKSLQVRIEEPD
ncbi:hypothetical protein ACTXT7_010095 [Hymenolepis weldensis]